MAEPSDQGCTTTRNMVIGWYRTYLGRDPENEGAIVGRLGMDCEAVRIGIASSEEAHIFARKRDTGVRPPPVVVPPKTADPIKDIGDNILGGILERLLDAILPIKGVSDDILAALDAQIDSTFPAMGKVLDNISRQLDTSINALIPDTIALVGAALGGVETLVATVLSNQADIGDIGDFVAERLKDAKLPFMDGIMDLLIGDDFNLIGNVGKKISESLVPDTDDIQSAIGFARMIASEITGRDN